MPCSTQPISHQVGGPGSVVSHHSRKLLRACLQGTSERRGRVCKVGLVPFTPASRLQSGDLLALSQVPPPVTRQPPHHCPQPRAASGPAALTTWMQWTRLSKCVVWGLSSSPAPGCDSADPPPGGEDPGQPPAGICSRCVPGLRLAWHPTHLLGVGGVGKSPEERPRAPALGTSEVR